jgi:hypothetical protein
MDGFLSDGVSDLMNVVSFLLAIGGAIVSASKLIGGPGRQKGYGAGTNYEDSESLLSTVWRFIKSPEERDEIDSRDARRSFYMAFGVFAAVFIGSIVFSIRQDWDWLVPLVTLAGPVFEWSAFVIAFNEVDEWLGKRDATKNKQRAWKVFSYGCLLTSLLFGVAALALLSFFPDPIRNHLSFAFAIQIVSLILFFLFVGVAELASYIKHKLT